jgi:hypothetical protein
MSEELIVLCGLALAMAAAPAILFWFNLREYLPPPWPVAGATYRSISVLIPARNEEQSIAAAVNSALRSQGVNLEVVVLDDHSEDATARVVQSIANSDPRVRLISGPALPAGWCGKQYACWVLAHEARHHLLVFLDADVRLEPDALARMAAFVQQGDMDLASGIPRQEVVGLLEKLVIPLIHFILLGFLPMGRMRLTRSPGFAAGCGQLFITPRESYHQAGGHAAIKTTLHDGIKLPRAYREAGLKTDLFDATDLATCRMYRSAKALWDGLAKNAVEGLGSPGLILPMTVVLICGQVLPLTLLLIALCAQSDPWPLRVILVLALATAASFYPRIAAVRRFHQPALGALLHPIGVAVLLTIQWYALIRTLLGRPSTWKGRPYSKVLPASTRLEHEAP